MKRKKIPVALLATFGTLAFSGNTIAAPIDDLVGYWNFNGVDVDDATPNSATNGTADEAIFAGTGDPGWTLGPLCGHVQIGGAANEQFEISTLGADIVGATEITIMGWFRADSAPSAGNPRGIFATRTADDGNGTTRLYGLIQETGFAQGRIGSAPVNAAADSLTVGTWYHAAVVFDGTDRIFYIDGVEVGRDAQAPAITSIADGGSWVVGHDPGQGDVRRFQGAVDDLAIFSSAIDATTIAGIATKDLDGNPVADLAATIDPTYTAIANPDLDGDDLCDTWEEFLLGGTGESGTDDTDSDNLSNANEMNVHFTNPDDDDSDGDSVLDGDEVSGTNNTFGPNDATDPLNPDSDGDSLTDGDELDAGVNSAFLTNPNSADTDNDGFSDDAEISFGSDPTDSGDTPNFYPNIVGYWPLDNATGTTATQKADTTEALAAGDGVLASGGNLEWKLSSGAGDGICGYVDLSNDNNSYFRINPIPGLETAAATAPRFTIMGWVKPRSSGYRGIFMTRDVDDNAGPDTNQNYGLALDGGGTRPEARLSGAPLDGLGGNLATDTWHHLAMTYDGTTASLYVNGVLDTSAPFAITEISRSGGWSLGADDTNGARRINACLDDFAVLNIDLPGSVIADVHTAGLAGDNLLTVFPGAPAALANDDSDDDGVCDQWELDLIGNLDSDFQPGSDIDMDGIDDVDEIDPLVGSSFVTNPNDSDTDDDGALDGAEIDGTNNTAFGNEPTDPTNDDSDGDGILDGDEMDSEVGNAFVTNPNSSDTDADGVSDNNEITRDSTDPTNASSVSIPEVTADLASYYNFDEGTGIVANDTAPTGVAQLAGTAQGTIAWDTTTPLIGAASLDIPNAGAPNTSMDVEDPFDASTTAYTISVFVYANSLGQNGRGGILNHRGDQFWGISTTGAGGSDYRMNNNNGGVSIPSGTIQTDKWHHVAITWDGSAGVGRTYVDGKLEATANGVTNTFGALSSRWDIGDDNCCGDREWRGRMDDLAFFTDILSDEEIETIADAGKAGIPLSTVLFGAPASSDIEIVSIVSDSPAVGDATITWNSTGGAATYNVISTTDLSLPFESWTTENPSITNDGATTSFTDTGVTSGTTRKFYVIREN